MHKNTAQLGLSTQQFRLLFDDYYAAIRNHLYYKCGNMEQAEDIAQDTFSILWKKRETVEFARAKSLLYTIAGNQFLNEVKHQKVVLKFQGQTIKHSTNQTPQFEMEMEEYRLQLENIISDLSEKQREVFLMNRIEKLKYKEIAERLGLSVKAVEKRMHQALEKVRTIAPGI